MKGLIGRNRSKSSNCLACLMLKKVLNSKLLINVLVSLSAVIVSVIIAEAGLRIYYGPHLLYNYEEDTGWELQPSQSGFSYPNFKCATINSNGFRGIEPSKSAGNSTRIVMIGDSFTFGVGVSDNETMAYHLQEILNRQEGGFEVYNLGEPGYGIAQMMAKYSKKSAILKPDIVVLTLIEDDISRRPPRETSNYIIKQSMRKVLTHSTLAVLLKPHVQFLRVLWSDTPAINKEKFQEYWIEDQRRLIEFSRQLREEGIVLIIFPYAYDESQSGFYDKARDFAQANGIPVADDILPVLLRYRSDYKGDVLIIEDDGHPAGRQYALAAEMLSHQILSMSEGMQ